MNRVLLTAVAFMSYMVMAGLLTQIGVILNAVSASLGASPEQTVVVFSWLTGGALCGTFASLFLYANYPIKPVLLTNYSVFLGVMLALVLIQPTQFSVLASMLLLLGFGCGCGLSGGAVIISKTYHEGQRASAFIATDCSFSAAGYLFPSFAAAIVATGFSWTMSYATVGVLALMLWALLFFLRFPSTEASDADAGNALQQFMSILTPRVGLMAVGVCIYLIAQTSFLTWAPNYLQLAFSLEEKASAAVVGNYWGMSIFGLITAAFIVNKVPQRWLLMIVALVSCVITLNFVLTDSAEWFLGTSYLFGLLTTCIYKIAMSVGSQQIARAPAMLVTFLLFSGSVGSTIAPALSGWVVQLAGVKSAIVMTWLGYALVTLCFGMCLAIERKAPASSTS